MMGHRALRFALFTVVSVILCSTARTAESPADCAEHFKSIYQVKKSKKFKTKYLCYLRSIFQDNFHDMTERGVAARVNHG